MFVPFVDLKSQYQTLKPEIDLAIQSVINSTSFIGGKYVAKFEEEFESLYGVNRCVSVANGTDAIYLSLRALGVGPGDEVITTAISWIATSEVISQVGATPVFVDVEDDFLTIDVDKIKQKITSNTKAIIPVHLYGQACDIKKIKALCDEYNLYLIEDCAQAHFAEFDGKRVGTFGDVGTFSFYPGKNLGAYGDGGAIITNNDEIADRVRMIAQHGSLVKHQHVIEGVNSRLDGIQAAILSVKLPHILEWNQKRLDAALTYNNLLADVDGLTIPQIRHNCKHIFHVYCMRVRNKNTRDRLQNALAEREIQTGVHYPTPLPLLAAYDRLNHSATDFPIAKAAADTMISLPMFPELSREQQTYVCNSVREALDG